MKTTNKTMFVGDLHGKPDLLPLISHAAERERANRIVLLGDICDDWQLSNNMMAAWFKTFADWHRSESRQREVVTLVGNHDVPYLLNNGSASFDRVRNIAPGFRPGAHRRVHDLMQHIPFKLAWTDGSLIATHAGITEPWEIRHDLRGLFIRDMTAWLNMQLNHPTTLASLYMEIGAARGGDSKTPSPLWADKSELLAKGERRIPQVVGHTPVPTVTQDDDFWFCDTFSTTSDGRPIGDGSLLVKDSRSGFYVAPLLG